MHAKHNIYTICTIATRCIRTWTLCDVDAFSLMANKALHAGAAWGAGARLNDRHWSNTGAFLSWTTRLVVFTLWTLGHCMRRIAKYSMWNC